MPRTGEYNALTDVQGLEVGHFTDLEAACGVTVVLAPHGAVAGVDVRGAAPGTRETDLLSPLNLVQEVQAVVLSGGSVYGLAASDGVVRWLAALGRGFPLEDGHVAPIVPAAVLFDLGRGKEYTPPINPGWGTAACEAARTGPVETGTVGAGTGAQSGSIKGGFGTASLVLDSGITVAAAAAVNSLGSVVNPLTGIPWEIGLEVNGEFGEQGRRRVELPPPPRSEPARNTTLGVVATDAVLTKAQVNKVAQMAHDGLARAIRPAHTMFDGDTIFCLATGKRELPRVQGFFLADQAQGINEIGHGAADCFSRAVIRAVLSAKSLANMTAWRDLPER
jgi:L-aminopeptidase/D-esterase-like protein